MNPGVPPRAVGPDRIADPWGARTPYAAGEQWPVRIDMQLAEGVAERDVERWVPSASILHSNGDGQEIAVKDGRIAGVRGLGGDRVNHGYWDRDAPGPDERPGGVRPGADYAGVTRCAGRRARPRGAPRS